LWLLRRGSVTAEQSRASMPVVAVILLTLVFWSLYWFVRMGGIDHFRAKSAQRKEDERRAVSRELERTAVLRAVDDPRDAATILMWLIPRGGDPTPEQIAAIEKTVATEFEFEHELTERLTQARFIAAQAQNFDQAGRIFSDLFKKRLTVAEKQHLIAMLQDIARFDGPSPAQITTIAALEQRIGLAAAR
jgi:hypothetical protein